MRRFRTALYGRTSKDDKRKLTIEIQQAKLRHWSAADPFVSDIVAEFWDDGVSGKIPLWERPEGKRMLADLAAKRIESVASVFIDRLGRTTLDSLQAAAELERQGVAYVAVEDGWDARRGDDPLYFQIRAAIAEAEWRRIKDRMESGKQRAAERDNAPPGGALIFGYRMGPRGEYILDPVEAPIIARLFAMAIEGYTCFEMHAWLESTGVAAGRRYQRRAGGEMRIASCHATAKWHPNRISQFFRERAYMGERVWGGKVWPCPPIVDRATWEKVQEICRRRAGGRRGHAKIPAMLSGLVQCGRCQSPVYPKREGRYRYYVCRRRNVGTCEQPRIRAEVLEGAAWRKVKQFLDDPDEVVREVVAANAASGEDVAALDAEGRELDAKLTDIEKEVAELWAERERNNWPIQWVKPELNALNARREKLVIRQADLHTRRAVLESDRDEIARVAAVACTIQPRLQFANEEDKRQICRAVLAGVVVKSSGKITLHFAWGRSDFTQAESTTSNRFCLGDYPQLPLCLDT